MVPIATYYVTLHSLESSTIDDLDRQVWLARFSSFAVTIAMWIVLSAPMVVWKYLVRVLRAMSPRVSLLRIAQGKTRVMKLADHWTRADALSAPSYGAAAVWKATAPELFKGAIVRAKSVS